MKVLEFKKTDPEKKKQAINKLIEELEKSDGFMAVTVHTKDPDYTDYKFSCYGLTNEKIVYGAELIKLNLFEDEIEFL